MAQLNIPSYRDDPNYRYKMPRLKSKVEGRGNGIKTNIMNMGDIARALKRPPEYPTKFCGHELGAQTKFESSEGKAIVNGSFESKDLQQLIDKFVEKFVLCPSCHLPEIDITLRKSRVGCLCNACGHTAELDNTHKLAAFIVRNPPSGCDSTMGKKSSRRADKADKRKKLPEEGETKDKERRVPKKSGTAPGEQVDDVDKVKLKSKRSKNVNVTTTIEGSDSEDQRLTFDSAEIPEIVDALRRFHRSSGSDLQNSMTVDNEVDASTVVVTDLQDASQDAKRCDAVPVNVADLEVTPESFFQATRALQVSYTFDRTLRFFIALHVLFSNGLTADAVESEMPFIIALVDNSMSTSEICTAFEEYMARRWPKSVESEYPFILQKLYNSDCVVEKRLVQHYERSGSMSSEAFQKAKDAAQPFIDWLKADEDEDEED